MKKATTLGLNRRWVRQWRETAVYLDEIKRDELANMTDEQGRRAIESVLSLAPHQPLTRISGPGAASGTRD